MIKIAQVGTFNVDNLGDLLFPVVFERIVEDVCRQLNEDYQIKFFSPNNTGIVPVYEDQKEVEDLINFNEFSFDKIFVGGGDLLRSDDWSINKLYKTDRLSFSHIVSPTNKPIDNFYTIGLGVPFQLEGGFSEYVKNSFKRFKRVSVRDQRASVFLTNEGITNEIIPDLVLSISRCFPKSSLESIFNDLVTANGVTIQAGQYIVFQANNSVINNQEINEIANSLNLISQNFNLPLVLISIGECLGDNELYHKLKPLLNNCYLFNKEAIPSLTMMEKVSLLANAKGFIGSSLHGNIISYSYSIPHVTFSGEYSTKLTGFFELINKTDYCLKKPEDLSGKVKAITDYFSGSLNNTEPLSLLTDRLFNFIKDALLDNSKNEDLASYSQEIDDLFKVGQNAISKKNSEISALWDRVNIAEKNFRDTLINNEALWKRVNEAEKNYKDTLSQNEDLWHRVNDADQMLMQLKEQVNKLWERVNSNETLNNELSNTLKSSQKDISDLSGKISNLEDEKKELLIEQERLSQIEIEYNNVMKSFFYYLKKKLIKKGNS
ncbi:polysaccharide pyruvyl transferase family protein [Paenibacillus jiagnxiensis]|uniref:polysaccharide pyruvyl transferase family protein n=1 Tax=Paenibacillus jiagnxiensis TaxID=3228926 RepID=UPI0033BA36A6